MSISITLDPETEERIHRLASQSGQSDRGFLMDLLERALEDAEDIVAATEVLARISSGEEQFTPLSEVMQRLGLEDQPVESRRTKPGQA
jgi:predicted DNA-binding protein